MHHGTWSAITDHGPASVTDDRLAMEEGWLMDWLSGPDTGIGGGKWKELEGKDVDR